VRKFGVIFALIIGALVIWKTAEFRHVTGISTPDNIETSPEMGEIIDVSMIEAETSREPEEIKSISDIDFATYSQESAAFVGLEAGQTLAEANAKIETYFTPGQGRPDGKINETRVRDGAETSFSTVAADGGTVIIAERTNMADDAVRAQRLYLITKKHADGRETVVDFGMKAKCWRGASANQWTKTLCP